MVSNISGSAMKLVVVPRRVPCGPIFLTGGLGLAAFVLLRPDEAVAGGFDAHPRGQRVHDADPHAVQTARDLVAAAAELAAGVEDRVDDLEGVLAGRMLADRHAAAVVLDGHHAVGLDRDLDRLGLAGHRLVDRVVDDFPDEVVQAAGVGRADVHARALANGLETLEDLDAGGVVVRRVARTLAAAVGCRGRTWRRAAWPRPPPSGCSPPQPPSGWRRPPSGRRLQRAPSGRPRASMQTDGWLRSRGSSGQALVEAPEFFVAVVLDHDPAAAP